MNATSYGTDDAADVRPGEHIPGPPHGGLIVLWIGWILAAVAIFGLGGMVFFGILDSVAASPF